MFQEKLNLSLIVAFLALGSCGQRDSAVAAVDNPPRSCRLQVAVTSLGPLREGLAQGQGNNYLTCPFGNDAAKATIFLVNDRAGACDISELFGQKVVGRKFLSAESAAEAASRCSPISSADDGSAKSAKTFVWEFKDHLAASTFSGSALTIISKAGLPVLRYGAVDNVVCFEVDRSYTSSLIDEVEKYGFIGRDSTKEISYQNGGCAEAVKNLYDLPLPMAVSRDGQ